ncbi:MAG: hypothetical protein KGL93_06250 [Gemmatimonadota bacterium]|nr:hypothetical protein [Gemmatimonadota bacterium]
MGNPARRIGRRISAQGIATCTATIALIAIAGACTEPRPIAPTGTGAFAASRGWTHADSAAAGDFDRAPASDAISDGTASIVSVSPSLFQGYTQPNAIDITLAGPVNSVTVVGNGAIECSGDYGTLTGFDAAGTELGSVPLELIDPSDCSPPSNPDNVTYGAHATLTVSRGIIASVRITPMSPLEFPVFDLVGHASQLYTVTLGVAAPPPATLVVHCDPTVVRGQTVSCTATVTPTQPYVVTHRHADGAGYTFDSADRISQSDGAPYEWSGQAVIDTHVSITVEVPVNGTPTALPPGTSELAVTPRTGAEWTGLEIPATTPTPEYVAGPPLLANPFPTLGTLLSPDGAIGQYQRVIAYYWGTVANGPNTNLVYTRAPATIQPPHIYIHAWLLPTSAFYRAQHANPNVVLGRNHCSAADIDRLRNNTIAHEDRHYTEDRAFFENQDVQAALEAAHAEFDVSTLGQPGSGQALTAARDAAAAAAYKAAWDGAVKTAVDQQYPVQTPDCIPRQP